VITFFHIVLGELAPKSLAIQRPKAFPSMPRRR
jgi:CBS domain containing-hemolysin-like protein